MPSTFRTRLAQWLSRAAGMPPKPQHRGWYNPFWDQGPEQYRPKHRREGDS